jgi:hypothetical protein
VVVGVSTSALLPAVGVQVVFVDEAGAKQGGALEVLWRTGFEHVFPVRSFGSFQGFVVVRDDGRACRLRVLGGTRRGDAAGL